MNNTQLNQNKGRKLSTLWVMVSLNIILADVLSLYVEIVDKNTLNIPGDVKTFMVIGALMVNIPIMMIYLSKFLSYKPSRMLNLIAPVFTILFVIGGGSTTPHYIVIATIEVIILCKIIIEAWKWKESVN